MRVGYVAPWRETMELGITVDRAKPEPLQEQLVVQLRRLIEQGSLGAGHPLPSTRALSEQLGVARVTVTEAYSKLKAQGFIEFKRNARPVVVGKRLDCPPVLNPADPAEIEGHLNALGRRISEMELIRSTSADLPELSYGGTDFSTLPIKQWQVLVRQTCERINWQSEMNMVEDQGYLPLRAAIAEYVGRTRGIVCDVEQVLVFSGAQQGINLVASLLLDFGDLVAVEEPGFVGARQCFRAYGAELLPVPIDQFGATVPADKAKLLYASSLHQDPTGVITTTERRQQLLAWANKHDAIVLEDDFDFHFRASGKALPALAAMDESRRVIYVSTFWKTLHPLCQVGFMIVPAALIDAFHRGKLLSERSFSLLENVVLAKFLSSGAFEQHVERARKQVQQRRRDLIYALARHFGESAAFNKSAGGTHLCVRFRGFDAEMVEQAAQQVELALVSTRHYYQGHSVAGEYLIHFADMESTLIDQRISALADALRRT